jgi:hypothetical protein
MWGPLLVRSQVTPSVQVCMPVSSSAAAVANTRAEVAQAWEMLGPVIPSAPIMPANHGAP